MKKNILLFLIATCSISTNAFSKPVEIKAENDKLACVISYDTKQKGSLANFGDIVVRVEITSKTNDHIFVNYENLFKDLKIRQITGKGMGYKLLRYPNRATVLFMEYILPVIPTTAILTLWATFTKWISNNSKLIQEESSLAKTALISTIIATIGTYVANKCIKSTEDNTEYLRGYKSGDIFYAYASKKVLDKKRLELNIN